MTTSALRIVQVGVDDLKLADYNPRRITDDKMDALRRSIRKFGFVDPIVVNKHEGRENVVVGGHQRLEAAKQEGYTKAPVVYVELPEEEERLLNVALNGEYGDWDPDPLGSLVAWLKERGQDLTVTGFTEDRLDSLLQDLKREQNESRGDPDETPEPPKVAITKPGDIWIMGEHRVLCGDSTNRGNVVKVMEDGMAALLFTSPPYWVGKDYESQKSEEDITGFIRSCVRAWTDSVRVDEGRIVVNTGTAAIHRIERKRKVEVLPLIDKWAEALRQRGWLLRHIRIWAKSGHLGAPRVSPKTDVVDQHWEHLAAFENEEWDYLGSFWSPSGVQRGQEKIGTPWAQQGVWSDIQGDMSAGGTHVAAFPVELPTRHLMLYTKPGEVVLEPFLGSGTTLIAAERLGRACRGIELDPKYVDVSCERWQRWTGDLPVLESTGEPVDFVNRKGE